MRGAKLDAAISAARWFLVLVDGRRDRVGLASFDSVGRRDYLLTQDLNAVSRQLDGLGTGQGTRIDLGLEVALEELRLRGRDGTPKMIVLLSDGQPTGGSEEYTLELAQLARQRGVTVVAVGLGGDVDGAFLQRVARTPACRSPDRFSSGSTATRSTKEKSNLGLVNSVGRMLLPQAVRESSAIPIRPSRIPAHSRPLLR